MVERGKYSFFKEPEDYTLLSHLHIEKGDTEQARSVLDMVEKRFAATPEIKAEVQVLKAMSRQKEGKPEQAKALLNPLLVNPDGLPESVRMDLIKTCFLVGDNEVAANLLGDMMQNNHDNPALKEDAIKMLKSIGKNDQANVLARAAEIKGSDDLWLRDG